MTFCNPQIDKVFDTSCNFVNTIVIENKSLLCNILFDIYNQIDGFNGESTITVKDKISDFSKNAELFTSFIPFEINRKTLLSKISSAVEKESINPENYASSCLMMTEIERYLNKLVSAFDCNLTFPKITTASIIKAAGIEVVDDYSSISEKIIDYMELVREFDRDKLFFTVNLRDYIDDDEATAFIKTVLDHEYNLIMIESTSRDILLYEERITVDNDLCEF